MPPLHASNRRWAKLPCWDAECSKTFWVAFVGLILMTAGFFLTMAGWFAPPINQSVYRVRLAGPMALLVGLVLLLFACLMCGVLQGRCCVHCVHLFQEQTSVLKAKLHHHHTHQPHAGNRSFNHNNHAHHCADDGAEYVFESGDDVDGYQRGLSRARPATLIIRDDQPTCVVNQNACDISPQHTRKKHRRSRRDSTGSECGYHIVEHPLASSPEVVIPCPPTPHFHSCHDTCSYQTSSSSYVNKHAQHSSRLHVPRVHNDSPSVHRHNIQCNSPPVQRRRKETCINEPHSSLSSHHGRTPPGHRSEVVPFSDFVFTRQPPRQATGTLLTAHHDVSSTSGESSSQRPSPYEIHSDV